MRSGSLPTASSNVLLDRWDLLCLGAPLLLRFCLLALRLPVMLAALATVDVVWAVCRFGVARGRSQIAH